MNPKQNYLYLHQIYLNRTKSGSYPAKKLSESSAKCTAQRSDPNPQINPAIFYSVEKS
jgi:hypothetical protein